MIEIRNCCKTYRGTNGRPDTVALDGANFTVGDREFISLLGPSGCGKTTLLKIIAGLVLADEGEVLIGGQQVTGPHRPVRGQR